MMSNANNTQIDIFHVISDPTRRQLLDLIASEPLPVKILAQAFAMSRPAVSQHLRVLQRAGLVIEKKVGREHYYQLCAAPLQQISDWVQPYERFWQDRLVRLGNHLDNMEHTHEEQENHARGVIPTPSETRLDSTDEQN